MTQRLAFFISSKLIQPSQFVSAMPRASRRICRPIISMSPPPKRCGVLRPEPPFLAMVMPAPASR